VDHVRLGDFLNSFDVVFMSYSRCNFNTNACPAKLWDYLGTGKPIIANAANPETLLWSEAIRVGDTPGQFVGAVRDALAEDGLELRTRRLEIAHAHTWEQLGHRMEAILEGVTCNPSR
jgi:hypothetical protein